MRKVFVIGCLALLASCGDGGGGGSSVSTTATSTPAPTPTATRIADPATVFTFYAFIQGNGVGISPNGPILQASDGNFYGTTQDGGASGCPKLCGTVFRITPGGTATALHVFADGDKPAAPLIQGRDGALYGTTAAGGANGAGTVFRIALDGTYSTLYSFGAAAQDGASPASGVIQGSDGNFYGTTSSGGANRCAALPGAGGNCGTVFRLTPAGVETILYSFGGTASDGTQPLAPLVQGSDGTFYGTTVSGGTNSCSAGGAATGCGTVFAITASGVESILHSFGANSHDGIGPRGPLLVGRDGAFYGTTLWGGQGSCNQPLGCGTVYRITAAGAVSILHEFAIGGIAGGYRPSPFLIQAKDGNFYGTTDSGGRYGNLLAGAGSGDFAGTAFSLTPAGTRTVLYSFGGPRDAEHPLGGLIQASDGAFYGINNTGVLGSPGTVFKMTVP